MRNGKTKDLRVVALLVGDPNATELWTLRQLSNVTSELHVVQAKSGTSLSRSKRLKNLLRVHGALGTLSRLLGNWLIGNREQGRSESELDRLFELPVLREWWQNSGIKTVPVPHLNHPEARKAIAALRPDVLVRVSGGLLKRDTFALARLAALNIHHGQAPQIRGMWSIPWGLVEGQPGWIGATVHVIDDGIDTGPVLWRGSPQLAPGDSGTTLFFRSHLEAEQALTEILRTYAQGLSPVKVRTQLSQPSAYRSAPGLGAWIRYLWLSRGKRAALLLERAVKC